MVTCNDIFVDYTSHQDLIRLSLGKVIARHRSAAGFMQRPFSRVVGISNSHLRSIEDGKTSPTLVTLCKIATSLGERPSDLIAEACDLMDEAQRVRIDYEAKPDSKFPQRHQRS